MSDLAIYSDDYDPRRLYATEGAADDTVLVRQVARFGDGPAVCCVDFRETGGRIVWSFRGKRGAETSRTEYFIGDFQTAEEDLFAAFADALQGADEWSVPEEGTLRWDLGTALSSIESDLGVLDSNEEDRLLDTIENPNGTKPLILTVADMDGALAVLRSIAERTSECRVAIGGDGEPAVFEDLDVLIQPESLTTASEPGSTAAPRPSSTTGRTATDDADSMHPSSAALGGIAGAALVVLLGFSVLSFVTAEPVHPITGLACIGGFVGTLVALVLLTPTADEPTPPLSGGRPTLATLLERPARTVSILAYTTVWAFLFPTIFRVGGRFLTGSNWLVGPVTTPRAAFLSVELFVLGLYVVTALLVTFFEAGPDGPRDTLIRLAIGAAIYAAGLFVATGLATPLWFRVIPAA